MESAIYEHSVPTALFKQSLNVSVQRTTLRHMVSTSEVEVTQISKHGIWLLLKEKEHFLSFEDFPWFKDASVSAIHKVELLNHHHLYWPKLDVDLSVKSIETPRLFPLIAKSDL